MHAGKIGGDTAAGRVYRALSAHSGEWVDAGWLARIAGTDALSTRVSEVRRQVGGYAVLPRPERRQVDGKPRFFYRLNRPKSLAELGQAEMFGEATHGAH